jgi:hypothetical protein
MVLLWFDEQPLAAHFIAAIRVPASQHLTTAP